jgi:TonB family protein
MKMRNLNAWSRVGVVAVIAWCCGHCIGQSSAPAPPAGFDASIYENTSTGLQRLLTDSIAAAKADEAITLDRILDSMRIPDPEKWFATTKYHSESWVEAYAMQAASAHFGVTLKCLFHELGDREGSVTIHKIGDGPVTPGGFDDGWMKNLKQPLDAYLAEWRDRTAEGAKPDWIGYFVYVGGEFRWYSIIYQTQAMLPRGWMPRRMVMPKFPYPLDGNHASGIVHVKFRIGADGMVDDLKIITSYDSTKDPKLIRAAMDAVRTWNFAPIPKMTADPRIDDLRIKVRPSDND